MSQKRKAKNLKRIKRKAYEKILNAKGNFSLRQARIRKHLEKDMEKAGIK